jgi:hypothetical protein
VSKVYSFGDYVTPAGTVNVTMTTSTSSGTQTVTQKYFTGIRFTRETDFFGGDIVLGDVEFDIEHDWDNLFHSTILPVVEVDNQYVTVELKHNAVTKFIGVIHPESIHKKFWYDSGDFNNPKVTVSFKCLFYTKLAQLISVQEVVDRLVSDLDYIPIGYTNYFYRFSTLDQVLGAIFAIVQTNSGISTTIVWNTRMTVATRNDKQLSDTSPASTELIPLAGGDIKYTTTAYAPITSAGLIIQNSDTGATYTRTGNFDLTTTPYSSAEDIYKSIIKDLGLVMKFDILSSASAQITITERETGSSKTLSDIIEYSESAINELNVDSVEVKSNISSNTFTQEYAQYSQKKFNHSTMLDINMDGQSKALQVVTQGVYSGYLYPLAVGRITRGDNLLADGEFSTVGEFNNWTTSGTWAHDTTRSLNPFVPAPLGCAKGTGAASEIYIQHEVDSSLQSKDVDRLLLSFFIQFDTFTGNEHINIYFLDSSSNVLNSLDVNITNGALDTTVMYIDMMISDVYRVRTSGTLKYVRIGIEDANGVSIYVDGVRLYRASQTIPDHLGAVVCGYFNPSFKTKKTIECHGVQDVNITDNIEINGQVNYVKRVSIDYMNNKTEIEAINYQ